MQPECIILDEPTAMLDPQGRKEVMATIREMNRGQGITIVLITHYMDEAAQCDRIVVMDKGSVVLDDTPRTVFSHVEQVKEIGLDVPQVTELAWELRRAGCDIPQEIITEEECVEAIKKLFAHKSR
jgi:energy-coupling factor transport system ATP-binding protein